MSSKTLPAWVELEKARSSRPSANWVEPLMCRPTRSWKPSCRIRTLGLAGLGEVGEVGGLDAGACGVPEVAADVLTGGVALTSGPFVTSHGTTMLAAAALASTSKSASCCRVNRARLACSTAPIVSGVALTPRNHQLKRFYRSPRPRPRSTASLIDLARPSPAETRGPRCWFHWIANVQTALPKSAHPGVPR